METLYIKVNIKPSDKEVDNIRNAGLFFSNIADAVNLDRGSIIEIDEINHLYEIRNIKNKFKNDKS